MARTKKVVPVSFADAIKNYWLGYIDFEGSATRREYWYAWLFCLFVAFVSTFFFGRILTAIVSAIMFLPSRALAFRRFHDVGLSGWWYLGPLLFITIYSTIRNDMWTFMLDLDMFPTDLSYILLLFIIYVFALLIVFVQPSKLKGNKYRK